MEDRGRKMEKNGEKKKGRKEIKEHIKKGKKG